MKRLFLLDGMALLYQSHFAFAQRPILTSKGFNTSALFGFTNTLLKLIDKHDPSHLAIALDTSEPTIRHREYPDYKAGREAMPEALSLALPHFDRLCQAFQIRTIRVVGYEADDIIGTLSRRAEAEGFETYMVSPDKDFAQLVSESTFMLKPGRKGEASQILKIPDVLAEWGIERTDQVVDILGLWGDASDNIPGVYGIGKKGASQLIRKYGNLESLLEHLEDLKGKQKENLHQHHEIALLSKRLAQIDRNIPLDISLDALKRQSPKDASLRELCVEFEFNTIGRRLFGKDFKIDRSASKSSPLPFSLPSLKTKKDSQTRDQTRYQCIQTRDQCDDLVRRLKHERLICFGLESIGADPKTAKIIGLAFSIRAFEAFYVPNIAYENGLPVPDWREHSPKFLEIFREIFEDASIQKLGHNLKFDLSVLRWQGISVAGNLVDTMLMHALIEPDSRHGLDFLAAKYLDDSPIPFTKRIATKNEERIHLPLETLTKEAAENVDLIFRLDKILQSCLAETSQESVYFDIEMPLMPVLIEMEYEGVRLDSEVLSQLSKQLAKQMGVLKKEVYDLAGREFNLNSPKQLGEILFDQLHLIAKPKKTKTGQYATHERVLESLAARHPIVRKILDYRALMKLKSTYADALPETIFPKTKRIHTTFHQMATTTGRLNSQSPNLQNIPIRSVLGQEIRRAFIPRAKGYQLLSADYSQIELRILAALSGDESMKAAFANGEDIHTATAAKVFGISQKKVSPEMRRKAKSINFGVAYGMSAFGLSQRLGISRQEAAAIIAQFFASFPRIENYIKSSIQFAKERGYVETRNGRRRALRDIRSANATLRKAAERNAINSPIQGTAADMIKIAMTRIGNAIQKHTLKTRLLLQVHDELVFDLWKKEEEEVCGLIEKEMKNALHLDVPIEVTMGRGDNWLEAHS